MTWEHGRGVGWLAGVLALCLALAAGAADDLTQPKATVIPLLDEAPALDGRLDDACWGRASQLTNFLDTERLTKTVPEQTIAWVFRDRQNLYFAFRCFCKDPSKTIAERSGRDAYRAFKDDVVEIMLDTGLTRNDFYHFCVNSIGAIWDAETHRLPETERMISTTQWNSNAEAKGGKEKDAWCVEVKIPLVDLGDKAQKAVAEGGKWGLQVARENWSANEFSTWSRTYAFTEAKDFGTASFAGAAARETMQAWKQEADPSLVVTSWPARRQHDFARVFVFGPEKDDSGAPISVSDPAGALYVHPGLGYAPDRGYGFGAIGAAQAVAHKGYLYGKAHSPLVKQWVGSREKAEFLFNLPPGQYRAIVTSGGHATNSYAPTETRVEMNGAALVLENPMPFRAFVSKKVDFAVADATPVKAVFSSPEGLGWLVNHVLVYHAAEEPQAAQAFDSLERDFFNYPVEEKAYKTAKVWVEYPPPAQTHLTDEEKEAGFAVVALPAAHFTPRNCTPQAEDSRGPLRAMTSPGERAAIQAGFYALRPCGRLEARLGARPEGVEARLMQTRFSMRHVGRGALGQWGYEPRTLWPVEPIYDLPAGRMQPYWLLLDVDPQARPGVRAGTVEFLRDGRKVAERQFRVTVLPFRPENRRFTWSMFYTPTLATPGWDTFTPQEKDVLCRVERTYLRDLKRHGIDYVGGGSLRESYVKDADGRWHFRPCDREALWQKLLDECGVAQVFTGLLGYEAYGPGAFILNEELQKGGHKPIASPPDRHLCLGKLSQAFFDNVTEITREQVAFYKSLGRVAPAFFVWDEPGDVNSPALAPFLDAVHRGGGRTHVTVVAGCFPALEGKVDNRDYNGIGLGVAGGGAESPQKLLERKLRDGTRNFVYQNGTIMGADPRQARFSFGYWAWAWNLDGLNPWKYWKIFGDPLVGATPFHPLHLANPDHIRVTTASWEMHAEAVFDNKLVQMLEDLTARPASPAATEAAAFLKALKEQSAVAFAHVQDTTSPLTGAPVVTAFIWPACRYDLLRAQLVAHLLRVTGTDAPEVQAEAAAVAADASAREAALTRRRTQGLPPVRTGNLLARGDCEGVSADKQPPAGFMRWSRSAAIQGEVAHSGKAALRMVHEQEVPNDNVIFDPVSLTPGRTYRLRGWARRQAEATAVSQHTGFWIHTYGPEGRARPFVRRMLVAFPRPRPDFDWTQFEHAFTAQAEERSVEVWVYYVDAKGAVWIDDVELTEMAD